VEAAISVVVTLIVVAVVVVATSTSSRLEVPCVGHRVQVVQQTAPVHVQGGMWRNGTDARSKQGVLHRLGIPPQGS
jgi:hypothetical protein